LPSISEADTETFLDRLYAASVEPDGWDRVMHALMGLFRTDMAHVGMHDVVTHETRKSSFYGYDLERLEREGAYYFTVDPWGGAIAADLASVHRRPEAPVTYHGGTLVPHTQFRESEYYRDFGRFMNCDDFLLMGGQTQRNLFYGAVVNTQTGRLFDEDEVKKALQVGPHVLRAMRLHQKMAGQKGIVHIGQFWNDSSVALVLVSNGRVDYENPAATALLSSGGPVTALHGRLHFRDREIQDAFEFLQKPRRPSDASRHHALAFHAQGDDNARWLVQFIVMRPVEGSIWSTLAAQAPGVMVAVTPLTAMAAARQNAIQGFIQLTETERDVLRWLVQGLSVEAVSRISGRRVATVRWHIRSLIEKLHARSIADVIRIGALLLPM
jgi:DNA-binding CsgD family transcriptional regulator